jgi:hypothetical protein
MLQPLDIFRVESDGSLRWMAAAANVESAKAIAKRLAPGEYLIADQTGKRISIKTPAKQVVFQVGYGDEKGLNARTELFRSFGHEVISVVDNEAAKFALTSIPHVDVFIVGHTAPEQTRKEMVDWLKANFPRAKIVALIPSVSRELLGADYNVVQRDWAAWLSLFATVS